MGGSGGGQLQHVIPRLSHRPVVLQEYLVYKKTPNPFRALGMVLQYPCTCTGVIRNQGRALQAGSYPRVLHVR